MAIIGAGMSGIAAAHRLDQAGVDYVILEKNADVGGTWLENRYPGCRVDVPNHFYSYSFAQTPDWPQYFADPVVLLDYFRDVCRRARLRRARAVRDRGGRRDVGRGPDARGTITVRAPGRRDRGRRGRTRW